MLHPVLGYIRRPSLPVTRIVSRARLDRMAGTGVTPDWFALEANNYGFFAAEDYPLAHPREQYVVGIFGGSVAQWVALQGGERLAQRLRASPLLADHRVRVLNFGQGGVKQPQQVLALNYFLGLGQRFDFVVNIDGFNEVALSYLNATRDVEISLPSSQHILPVAALLGGSTSEEYLSVLLATRKSQRDAAAIESLLHRNPSAALQVLLEFRHRAALRRYRESANALDALAADQERTPLLHLNEASVKPGNPAVFGRIGDLWMRSSILMDRLLQGLGVPYLHVLQPNQYHSQRTFTAEERRIAVHADSPYREPTEKGYPHLLSRLPMMRQQGVSAVSGVRLFDRIEAPVYSDSCCHYNQLGNEILADWIADRMIPLISEQDSRPPDGHQIWSAPADGGSFRP